MVVNLPPELDAFVTELVAVGRYRNVDEVLSDAVRALQEQRQSLEELLAAAMAHPEDDIVLNSDEELKQFMDDLFQEAIRERESSMNPQNA